MFLSHKRALVCAVTVALFAGVEAPVAQALAPPPADAPPATPPTAPSSPPAARSETVAARTEPPKVDPKASIPLVAGSGMARLSSAGGSMRVGTLPVTIQTPAGA